MVKNFGGKKFGEVVFLKHWRKKLSLLALLVHDNSELCKLQNSKYQTLEITIH